MPNSQKTSELFFRELIIAMETPRPDGADVAPPKQQTMIYICGGVCTLFCGYKSQC